MLWEFYHKKLNYFVSSNWSIDKKRKYRQTTGVVFTCAVFAFSSLILAIYYNLLYATVLEVLNIAFCFYSFKLLKDKKIIRTQKLGIYYFQIQVFITAVLFSTPFTNTFAWSYPLLLVTIYPVVAALFDLSIIKHFVIAFLQIVAFQILFNLVPNLFFSNIDLFQQNDEFLIKTVSFTYLILFNTTIVYLIYKEQVFAKEKVIHISKTLKRKNSRIEELNHSKDRLFSIISHDLRSPFNSIIGFSNLLLESKDLTKKERSYSEIINKSSKGTLTLIDNLLYWSKSQLKSIQPNFKTHKIKAIINDVIESIEATALQKNIIIVNHVNQEITGFVDANLIQIIIRNLITNSIKFSNNNGIVKVNAIQETDKIRFSVSDNGIGIEKGVLLNIFTQNVSKPGTNNEKGSGLGLFLCKEFVKLHNGKIWIESEKGKGTVVFFTIPLYHSKN
ncbi:Signal transduction histidine kinase [Lutibacter oricola]|uniref:histidine kinase n=1 Tax=Lutibacter oricola TaxID=762486 RepID=A0A1H3ESY3_9FLAO|nr:HAMP domain-containing sensor histidine kinase [Lutibacter oricola]SDX81760.1 Signal transduction histidine kinase [Lutibacter oricola]